MTFDDHPELAGYEPLERPLRGRRMLIATRIVVVVGVVALILPGVLISVSIATTTATNTCAVYVQRYEPDATSSSARFELTGPLGPGWQCYALNTEGDPSFVAPLGLIPSTPHRFPADSPLDS
ncbi:hypothetical protein ACFVWR_13120 [Leifsonia sp. NPDC058292]|uniref:hypothetical protein n=1 Tax=Leifsonia sp. NPDC058292 TaxID=3346428 RepID=UPI0036D855BC